MDVSILIACLGDYRPIVKRIKEIDNTEYSYEICVSGTKVYEEVSEDVNFFPDPGTSVQYHVQKNERQIYNMLFRYCFTALKHV